jgi:aspartyl-tRNA(Asn)/glutamyl-tRNA(Gln) amidotransferase subunit A
MNVTQITDLSLSELARAIVQKQISAVEAVTASLARIEEWQPTRNCFIRLDAERALQAAAASDRQLAQASAQIGSLHGVPLAHKDMFYRVGEVSTCGSKIRRDWVADTTATVLTKLDQAGALQLGTLNMAEFAGGPTGHNTHFGHCSSAYGHGYIAAGSSSGSGSAVGSRLVYGALGSDTGGSIRLPASANGVVGIKPTYGRVSRYGAMPRSWSLDHVGVLGRTAEDCARMLQVIAGHDPLDATTSHQKVPDYLVALTETLKGKRIGFVPSDLLDGVDEQVATCLDRAREVLRTLGAVFIPVKLADMRAVFDAAETIVKSEAASMHGPWLRTHGDDYTPLFKSRIEVGTLIPATDYIDALRLRGRLTQDFMAQTMHGIDMLQLPSIPFALPTLAQTDTDTADGDTIRRLIGKIGAYQRPINFFGLPSISIPGGFCSNGLPLGFQLIGHPFAEAELLAATHHFQQATPEFATPPKL